jgi:putative membrane protein
VSAHEITVKLFQKAARGAGDADVKAFAAKALPALEHHLQMARDLKATVDKEGNARAPSDRKQ